MSEHSCKKMLLFYAPNVNVGGGLVLLRTLLDSIPQDFDCIAFLDARAKKKLSIPEGVKLVWVQPSFVSRLSAEIKLKRVSTADSVSFCFHGLPPLMPIPGRVYVYLQNRLLFGFDAFSSFPVRTRLRLKIESLILNWRVKLVDKFLVQTPSMAQAIRGLLVSKGLSSISVTLAPFIENGAGGGELIEGDSRSRDGFIYVADSMPHKNHLNLLLAWEILAREGLYPKLILTLDNSSPELFHRAQLGRDQFGVNVQCIGKLSHDHVMDNYRKAEALIFPSLTESFGLPLIEATQAGLSILASELDYVRDVCVPTETFDPHSPLSIARAVKRFIGNECSIVTPDTPQGFWRQFSSYFEKRNVVDG